MIKRPKTITTAVQSLNLGFKLMCLFKMSCTYADVLNFDFTHIIMFTTSCSHAYMDFLTKLSSYTNVLHVLCRAVFLLCRIIIGKQMEQLQSGKTFHRIREGLWLTWYAAQKVGVFFGRKLKNSKFLRFLSDSSCRSALVLIVLLFQCNSVLII